MADAFIYEEEDVLIMLDALLASRSGDWWNEFYADRAKPCPFFTQAPDESLTRWIAEKPIHAGRALDLGCGSGRNAIFLAQQGFAADAVDYSRAAIEWAKERARVAGVQVRWQCQSVFDFEYATAAYDLAYDSGCFHHLAPHRRRGYVDRISATLKPGGWFGLSCFRPEGGSGFSDYEVYEKRSLGGGLGYTEERLREIWSRSLEVQVLRPMIPQASESGQFGEAFLWALLAQKTP